MRNVPVPIVVAHSHLAADARVDSSLESRETVHFSLEVDFHPEQAKASSFEGLFNYAAAHRQLQTMHGSRCTGPLEGLLDAFVDAALSGTESLRLVSVRASLRRPQLIDGDVVLSIERMYTSR